MFKPNTLTGYVTGRIEMPTEQDWIEDTGRKDFVGKSKGEAAYEAVKAGVEHAAMKAKENLEAPNQAFQNLEQEWNEAVKSRNLDMPVRTLKGRMDDIPEAIEQDLKDKANLLGKKAEAFKQCLRVDNDRFETFTVQSLIYFSPNGYHCGVCDNIMAGDIRNGKAKVFCTNPNCSENLIDKVFDLPFISDYQIVPSSS